MFSARQKAYHQNIVFSKHDFCDTIPVVYDDGQIYVDIIVAGQKRRFNIDTGAAQGALYGKWAESLLSDLGNVVSRDAAGNDDTVRVAMLPAMRLPGGLGMQGYVATVYEKSEKRKYDGVLGFDFFNSGLNAKIDIKARHVIVSDRKDTFRQEQGYVLRYRLKWFVPYLRISPFARHVDEVLFDTGSRRLYAMNEKSFRAHSYMSRQVMEQVADSVAGSFVIGNHGGERESMIYFLQLDRIGWGGFSFRNVAAMTTQGSSKLGASMLEYGSMIINSGRKQMTFVPYASASEVNVGNTLPTLAFVPHDGKAVIGFASRRSDAYKAGARSGDEIVSIDGRLITSFADFLSFPFIYDRENVFVLRSKHGGALKHVRIKRTSPSAR